MSAQPDSHLYPASQERRPDNDPHCPHYHFKLHIFLDRSIIELSVNNRNYFSNRLYPSRPDSLGLGLFAAGGKVQVKTLDIWQLDSIWDGSL